MTPMDLAEELLAKIAIDSKYFARKGGPSVDADDMFQSGVVAILEYVAAKGRADVALLRHVADCAMIDALRRRWARRADELTDGIQGQLASRRSDAGEAIDVRDAIAELSAEYRAAILSTLDGPPSRTHADLGLTAGKLESLLNVARRKLRKRLGDAYAEMDKKHLKRHGKNRHHARRRAARAAAEAEKERGE